MQPQERWDECAQIRWLRAVGATALWTSSSAIRFGEAWIADRAVLQFGASSRKLAIFQDSDKEYVGSNRRHERIQTKPVLVAV